jgi:hypothetical protein
MIKEKTAKLQETHKSEKIRCQGLLNENYGICSTAATTTEKIMIVLFLLVVS